MSRKFALQLIGFLAVVSASCTSSPNDEDLQPSVAIVYGVVRDESREPVADARVTIEAFVESCGAGDPFAYHWAVTDPAGFYRQVLGGLNVTRVETCVKVHVAPPAASPYREATTSGAQVTFVHQADTPPIDSVQVDVVLAKR